MPDRRTVDGLVADLGRALGLDELALDDEGRLRIELDGTEVLMAFDAEDDALWLASDIGRVPASLRDDMLPRLLAANLAAPARGPTFAIDTDTGAVVVMSELLEARLDCGDLEAALLGHVGEAERWSAAVAGGADPGAPAERPHGFGTGGVIWG